MPRKPQPTQRRRVAVSHVPGVRTMIDNPPESALVHGEQIKPPSGFFPKTIHRLGELKTTLEEIEGKLNGLSGGGRTDENSRKLYPPIGEVDAALNDLDSTAKMILQHVNSLID
jgi:hypothetical protein